MCNNSLIVSTDFEPLDVEGAYHDFTYTSRTDQRVFIEKFFMKGYFNYASVQEITKCNGVKKGYMFIIGEKDE